MDHSDKKSNFAEELSKFLLSRQRNVSSNTQSQFTEILIKTLQTLKNAGETKKTSEGPRDEEDLGTYICSAFIQNLVPFQKEDQNSNNSVPEKVEEPVKSVYPNVCAEQISTVQTIFNILDIPQISDRFLKALDVRGSGFKKIFGDAGASPIIEFLYPDLSMFTRQRLSKSLEALL